MHTSRTDIHTGQKINSDGQAFKRVKDPLAIEAIDHIELIVSNAKQACFFYSQTLGLNPIAYRGPETGYPDAASYVLQARKITLILTTPMRPHSPLSHLIKLHGDSAHDIALQVTNCEAFYHEAIKRGARSVLEPTLYEDEFGTVKRAGIETYGDTIHSIIERRGYKGNFWPGFAPYSEFFPNCPKTKSIGLAAIDHVVGNVELGQMNHWVEFYEKVLGFTQMLHFSDKQISTEYSALMSKVMRNGSGKIKFPINEPAEGKRKSQIEEYLDFHNGPGVQHIALASADIIKTVSALRKRGVEFLAIPKTYYEEIPSRVGSIKEDLTKIAELGILVDRDDDGYLLQIFTKPVQDRPTLFFEIIQRAGAKGFGEGNFKALFEAIEREQAIRGNL